MFQKILSSNMKNNNTLADQVAYSIIPIKLALPANNEQKLPKRLLNVPATNNSSVSDTIGCLGFKENNLSLVINRMNKFAEKANSLREHVRLGPKISETVKGKLRLGAQILQVGGVEKIFRRIFKGTKDEEELLEASQCYLSTTAGPIAGLLFISTHRVAFCSERSVKFSSPNGEKLRYQYKVSIPLRKIEKVIQSKNVKKPSQKYIHVITTDDFEFWFMGFLNYKKTFQKLKHVVSQAQLETYF